MRASLVFPLLPTHYVEYLLTQRRLHPLNAKLPMWLPFAIHWSEFGHMITPSFGEDRKSSLQAGSHEHTDITRFLWNCTVTVFSKSCSEYVG